MKITAIVCCLAAAALTGCSGASLVQVGDRSYIYNPAAPPPPISAAPSPGDLPLTYCQGQFCSGRFAEGPGCDVVSACHAGFHVDYTVVSARSRKVLMTVTRQSGFSDEIMGYVQAVVAREIAPGTELYREVAAERGQATPSRPAARQEPAEPPRPAPRAVSSDVDAIGRFTEKAREDDFAIVVGIENYQNIPKADYAEHDAQTMKKYFEALGVPEENVILLTGEKATKTGLTKYLEEWLPKNVTEGSRVYFYYSGHGAPDPADSTAYLVPWDGDASYLKSSAYPVSRLYEKLGALKAKQVVVMLDSCFSGAGGRSVIAQGARPLVNVVTTAVPASSRLTVLSASAGDQISGTINDQGHGMFTYYLLKGLKGAADPDETGHVSLGALYSYVRKSVEKAAHRDNREQSPELYGANPELRLY
jgi:hypothetical protein